MPCLSEVINLNNNSSLSRAVTALKNVIKFIRILKAKVNRNDIMTAVATGKECELMLLRSEMSLEFPEVVKYFLSISNVKSDIPPIVSQKNIFLDPNDKLLKVKSKMGKMTKGVISRTPILLSKSGLFTKLLISDIHKKYNHSGVYYTLHKLKQSYFILKSFSAVKETLQKCYHCRRFNGRVIKVNTNDYKHWNVNPVQNFFAHCFVDVRILCCMEERKLRYMV